jgi:phosphoenolpyruvate carboxykinase (GTP)
MRNEILEAWVARVAAYTCPARIHWCDGGEREFQWLIEQLVREGTLHRLNEDAHPGCFLHRSDPTDAVRTESCRFVVTHQREDAGPTNQWLSEDAAYRSVWPLFGKAMTGRTLFVVPYLLGSSHSKYAQVGVQLTDSPWVVLLMGTLTRMGRVALDYLGSSGDFARGLHSASDLSPERRFLVQFPATQTCWSVGTAYPESAALLKSHVLSLCGALAPEAGYLAEHMAAFRLIEPSGKSHYIAAAFPSGCGKTRLATLVPTLPGWKVELVADGTCMLRVGDDGRLWAMNAAWGIDGFVGDTTASMDPGTHALLARDTIFTNLALQRDGTLWWNGSEQEPREGMVDWRGQAWQRENGRRAAHANARFLTSAQHYSGIDGGFYDGRGVPLSAILFGGRRRALAPLVFEATSWEHAVYVGVTSRSEGAPCSGESAGSLRHDPMAMGPFCSYNMADYFAHWLRLGRQLRRPPRIFHVNWFRADQGGELLWPGFGENIRVLDWVVGRLERRAEARLTPIGFVPQALDTAGLDLDAERWDQLTHVDIPGWQREADASGEFLAAFGSRLPSALRREHKEFLRRLRAASN